MNGGYSRLTDTTRKVCISPSSWIETYSPCTKRSSPK